MKESKRAGAWGNQLNDGLTQAIELVLTPIVFAFFGFLIDSWLGTTRVFTIALAVFGLVGGFVVAYYRYEARIAIEDARVEAERAAASERR